MSDFNSKQPKLITGKIFWLIMVLLTLGMWAALFSIADQAWLLPMIIGMLLTFLSLYEITRYIKERTKF